MYTEAWDYLKESEPLLKIWSSSLILRSVSISPPLTNPHIPYKGVFQINSSNYSFIRPREHLDVESLLENHLRMNTCWGMNKAELGRKFNVDAVPTMETSELTEGATLKMAKQSCPKMRKKGLGWLLIGLMLPLGRRHALGKVAHFRWGKCWWWVDVNTRHQLFTAASEWVVSASILQGGSYWWPTEFTKITLLPSP